MRQSWVKDVGRVVAAVESLWDDPAVSLRDLLTQDDVLAGRLWKLHAEVVAAELASGRRARVFSGASQAV